MEIIMKKLAGLIIILAVLILGGYYGMGVLTEKTIKKNVEVLNQTNGVFADIQQYNRGWFNSDAQVKWRIHVPERVVKDANGNSQTVAAQDFQMEMPLKIHHGPIIYANKALRFGMGYAETVFPFPDQYNTQFDAQFTKESTKPQLDLNIFVNYLRKSTIELSLPKFKLVSKDGSGTFDWLGMESSNTVSSGMDKAEGEVVIEGMTFTKTDTKITLDKVTTEYDLHQKSGLYLGDASFTLPSFTMIVKDKKICEVKDFSIKAVHDIEDNLFHAHVNLDLQSVFANDKTYGPGELEFALRNLDADVLIQMNQQANAMQNGTEAERQQAMMAMIPELPKLFSKGAEFEISKCTFKIPEGTIDGNLLVSLPKGDNSNPFELMQKIQGNAKLKMPVALVKQLMQQSVLQQMSKQPDMEQALIQQLQASNGDATQPPPSPEQLAGAQADKQIGTLEQNGIIVLSGSDYAIELSLQQGKLTVNGKPFEPSMLRF
jgi:uncharacterized protein YdgA (DUF945 family)